MVHVLRCEPQHETHYRDGSKKIKFPDGTVKSVSLDGVHKSVFPDGTVMTEYPDGRKVHSSCLQQAVLL